MKVLILMMILFFNKRILSDKSDREKRNEEEWIERVRAELELKAKSEREKKSEKNRIERIWEDLELNTKSEITKEKYNFIKKMGNLLIIFPNDQYRKTFCAKKNPFDFSGHFMYIQKELLKRKHDFFKDEFYIYENKFASIIIPKQEFFCNESKWKKVLDNSYIDEKKEERKSFGYKFKKNFE